MPTATATASKPRQATTVNNRDGARPAAPVPADRTPGRVRLTIALDGTPYTVRPLARERLPFGAVRGFVLSRTDARLGRVAHEVVEGFEGLACSCGDQTFRQSPAGGRCKHLAACVAVGLF